MISRLATRVATVYESADVTRMDMRDDDVEAMRAEIRKLREEVKRLKKRAVKVVRVAEAK